MSKLNELHNSIRYMETDLEVTVGEGDDQHVYHYHSLAMALLSKYVDAMLSAPMKEGATKKIAFPDITPALWENLMKYLEPGFYELPSSEEAMTLVKYYHKYDFPSGLHLCDHILSKLIAQGYKSLGSDKIAEAFVCAHTHSLETATAAGVKAVSEMLEAFYGPELSVDILKVLAPVLCEHDALWSLVVSLMDDEMPKGASKTIVAENCFPAMIANRIRAVKAKGSRRRY